MSIAAGLASEVISHHLRLFGADDASINTRSAMPARLLLLAAPSADDVERSRTCIANGGLAVAVLPDADFCGAFGVKRTHGATSPPAILQYRTELPRPWTRLRTLHAYHAFSHAAGSPVLSDPSNGAAWYWLPVTSGGVLFIGTDLAGDLIRYRQGDPARDTSRPTEAYWGIAGERPNYLFEEQLAGEPPRERHADWWAMALAQFLAGKLGKPLLPLLPGGAPGAVIITGDDDQAELEKYAEQLALLKRTPVTYFLHPLTRHTQETIREMLGKPWIDLGIHPDALNAPERYEPLLQEQVDWYRGLTGRSPLSVRNHGFLNDGYWRHLPSWLKHDIRLSSNLPGLDGAIINGSLLPARLAHQGALTDHWSLLTAFGDGMVFALQMPDEAAAERIQEFASRIRTSEVPGIIVINLHPQNVASTGAMHRALQEIIRGGFYAWTMKECLAWFAARDGYSGKMPDGTQKAGPIKRIRSLLVSAFGRDRAPH